MVTCFRFYVLGGGDEELGARRDTDVRAEIALRTFPEHESDWLRQRNRVGAI